MKNRHLAANRHLLPLATAIATLLASHSAQAATETWTGATNTWNTSGNWTGTNLPPISDDSLIFGAAGAGGLNLNNDLTSGSFSLAGITFNAGAPAYVIGNGTTTANVGNTFVLTNNVTNNSTSLQTINTPFSMTAVRSFNTTAFGGNFTLSGNISGTGGGISKLKTGTLILSGTNSYTGETQLNNFGGQEGVLRANDGVGLPTTSNLNIRVGVFETGVDLVRVGGSAAGEMRLFGGVATNSANGFSAHGGAVNIAFGTLLSPTALTWGSGSFIPGSSTGGLEGLILNHTTANNTLDFKNAVNLNAAVRNVFVNATNSAAIATMSGNLTGTGISGLNKKGVGTLVLTGTNSYTGTTTVSAGTLLINGNSSTAVGAVAVNVGTLGGTGRTGGAVTVAGAATLSPGASIESLDVASLSMASTSVFAYEVANNTSTGADLLASRGTLSLTGVTLSLDPATLAALGAGGWSIGNKLTLISYLGADITSGFTGRTDDTDYTFGANMWRFNYNDTVAGGNYGADAIAGGQNRFVTLTVVPEPNVAALLGAFGALFLLRRRRD